MADNDTGDLGPQGENEGGGLPKTPVSVFLIPFTADEVRAIIRGLMLEGFCTQTEILREVFRVEPEVPSDRDIIRDNIQDKWRW